MMNKLLLAVLVTTTIAWSTTARAQYNDGTPSRVQHLCWQGIFDPIPEDLAWTWVGYEGQPVVGQTYRARIVVGGLGCSGLFALPQLKLPKNTQLAAGQPIRCYYQRTNETLATEINDGTCPQQPFLGPQQTSTSFPNANGDNNHFLAFPPTNQPYWPVPPGTLLAIEVPLVSSSPLSGIASNDYLLGAAQLLDNSPGNPAVVDDGPPAFYNGVGIPSTGAWQGVFVFNDPSVAPQIVYEQPITGTVTTTTAETHATVLNFGCVSPQVVRFNLLFPDLVTDPPGSAFSSGSCTAQANGTTRCTAQWTGLQPNTTYAFQATFDANTLGGCQPPVGSDQWQLFTTAPEPGEQRFSVLVQVEGNGTVTLDPPGGNYAAGTVVVVLATPDEGATFAGYDDGRGVINTNNRLSMFLDSNVQMVARFDGGIPAEGEGEGEGEDPVGEGEGEEPVGEGEGEDPVGEGEGEEPDDDNPRAGDDDDDDDEGSCVILCCEQTSASGSVLAVAMLGLLRRRRRSR